MSEQSDDILSRLAAQAGGLVEIWVKGATVEKWNAAVRGLVEAGYRVELSGLNGEEPPRLRDDMFTTEGGEGYELSLVIDGHEWWTHLYSTEIIDFQGRPEWITTVRSLDEVAAFMRTLSQAVEESSVFLPETIDDAGVGRYMTVYPPS